jgi:hypothetical protein
MHAEIEEATLFINVYLLARPASVNLAIATKF